LTICEFIVSCYLALGARLSAIDFWRTHILPDESFTDEANLSSTAALHCELFYNTAWSDTLLAQAEEKLLEYLEIYQDPELWLFAGTIKNAYSI